MSAAPTVIPPRAVPSERRTHVAGLRPAPALPGVSVVIPVFEHADRLFECLAAVTAQEYPGPFEILVVDNGAPSALEALVATFPAARLLHEKRAGSYAARNCGVASARYDMLAFTDADCVPAPGWLSAGVGALVDNAACGLVAGRIDVTLADDLRPTAAELYESVAAFRQADYIRRWRFGATANLFTRRDVFTRVGPFDAQLHSLGDREWGRRVHEAGFGQSYSDAARVAHPARTSLRALLQRARRMAGGYYQIARARHVSAGALLKDAPMGLAPRRSPAAIPPGRKTPCGVMERALVSGVTVAVVMVRAIELTRLLLGGLPRRA